MKQPEEYIIECVNQAISVRIVYVFKKKQLKRWGKNRLIYPIIRHCQALFATNNESFKYAYDISYELN